MPEYTFTCEMCGAFELRRASSEAGAPALCPGCGRTSRRVYVAPGLVLTSPATRALLAAEQQSAHEPGVTAEKRGRSVRHRHGALPPWAVGHS